MKKTGKLLQYCQFFCSFCCRLASASVPPRRRPSISIARWYRPLRVDLRPLFVWIQLFRIRCNHIPVPIIFHQTYDLPINWTGFFSVPTLPGLPQQTWWYFLNFGSDHCWQCSTRNLCSSGRLNETWPTLGGCRCRWRLLTDQSTKLILIYKILRDFEKKNFVEDSINYGKMRNYSLLSVIQVYKSRINQSGRNVAGSYNSKKDQSWEIIINMTNEISIPIRKLIILMTKQQRMVNNSIKLIGLMRWIGATVAPPAHKIPINHMICVKSIIQRISDNKPVSWEG